MTILFDASCPVKTSRRLGRGILASRPTYRADHTAADESWWASQRAQEEAELDRMVDEMHAESEAIARLEMGLCC